MGRVNIVVECLSKMFLGLVLMLEIGVKREMIICGDEMAIMQVIDMG